MGSVFLVLLVFFLLCDADRIQWDNDMRVYKWVFDGGAKLEGIFKSEDKERVVSRGWGMWKYRSGYCRWILNGCPVVNHNVFYIDKKLYSYDLFSDWKCTLWAFSKLRMDLSLKTSRSDSKSGAVWLLLRILSLICGFQINFVGNGSSDWPQRQACDMAGGRGNTAYWKRKSCGLQGGLFCKESRSCLTFSVTYTSPSIKATMVNEQRCILAIAISLRYSFPYTKSVRRTYFWPPLTTSASCSRQCFPCTCNKSVPTCGSKQKDRRPYSW